jgi:hypothetical protein
MSMQDKDFDGVARACRTLGVDSVTFTTLEDLKQVVIAKGRERTGCAGLADLLSARLTRLNPADASKIRERLRRAN